ncbi:MAG: metalloregulator ArsR/SmtB family transcription factor [Candidatus Altiarchaeales archaeon]|nr:metalloregulator ArsR/SmtB family transcription factor [Candidatus Altiarchaeota archaeon]MCG2782070.1 metalloregulator ArsR/SmtB family transcription factor [Candidatus Altiarchaeales archaeon]MBU4266377.1 metalloregulator ArsR/SmtB family transcription factor [Candidatus Altiarchaeota archaeon]MBU4341026.1 metalloregulator ArsR/SmtB family transcription factor [Candidatus Altiarchaeota archaeon]MBU4406422.1 metalloregulator ArsR/SmtB family transcription factor [Candidatus Altiarchaeota ar
MSELKLLKALSDETRLRILDFLRNGEKCVCEIIPFTGKSQPTVSMHLRVLKEAGLLKERKEGNKVFYSVADSGTFKLIEIARKIGGGKN